MAALFRSLNFSSDLLSLSVLRGSRFFKNWKALVDSIFLESEALGPVDGHERERGVPEDGGTGDATCRAVGWGTVYQ